MLFRSNLPIVHPHYQVTVQQNDHHLRQVFLRCRVRNQQIGLHLMRLLQILLLFLILPQEFQLLLQHYPCFHPINLPDFHLQCHLQILPNLRQVFLPINQQFLRLHLHIRQWIVLYLKVGFVEPIENAFLKRLLALLIMAASRRYVHCFFSVLYHIIFPHIPVL